MATQYYNGKAGVWRTVGGRKIFIANGQSLRDAMVASGKFKNLKEDKKVYEISKQDFDKLVDAKKGVFREPYEKLDNGKYQISQKDFEKLTELKKGVYEDGYKEKSVPTKYLQRGEMMEVIDKWSDKGFNEEGAYGNDGYGKGVLHQRDASGNLEGYGGDADDFVIKGMDMGSVDQKTALRELNKELGKHGYEAKYTKEADSTTHQDIEIRKIKGALSDESINKLKEINKQDRLKKHQATAEEMKQEYLKYDAQYKKYSDLAHNAQYGSEEYNKYAAKRTEFSEKARQAKEVALTEFHKTIPYDEMFEAGKQVSGSKSAVFGEPELVNKSGGLYVHYKSNDIRQDSGVFGQILRGARLENFSSELYIDKQTGELTYWGSMDIRYQHNGGGSNGMQIMQYKYKPSTGWDITDSAGYKYKNGKKITTVSGLTNYYMEYYGYSRENAKKMAEASLDDVHRRESMVDY